MCLNLSRQVSHYGDVGCQLTQIQEVITYSVSAEVGKCLHITKVSFKAFLKNSKYFSTFEISSCRYFNKN
jgi:hypothetical protein